jgi:drug/metabolite transporter (DMT)-like permease
LTLRTYHSLTADACLLLVTFFWALSYILVKISFAEGIQEMNLTSLRFVMASLIVGLVFIKKLRSMSRAALLHGISLGTLLFVIYINSTYALRYTTATNSAFLISLSVIFVPILSFFFYREMQEKRVIVGIVLAVAGMTLMLYTPKMSLNPGDLLSLICAILCGAQIIYTGRIVRRVDAIQLGLCQIFTVAVWSTVASLLFESYTLPQTSMGWGAVAGLGLLCTAIPFVAQPMAQQFTTNTRAGLIFSMEALFATMLAFLVLGEVLAWRGYLGGLLMLVGIITAELDVMGFLLKGKKRGKYEMLD